MKAIMKFKAFLVTEEDVKYNRSYYHRLWFWNEYFRGYQEYVKVPSEWVVPLPKNMPLKDSMIYGTAGLTTAISVYK